jgi:O-antigen/teichoic acid export membrane protein
MNLIRRNLVANFSTFACMSLVGLLVAPLYMDLMGEGAVGKESWGLAVFFTLLFSLLGPIGQGLTMTLGRELAWMSVKPDAARPMRDLVRTLELAYWSMAIVMGALVILAAPLVAHYWINPVALSPERVTRAVMLMGIALTLQWPYSFYAGGLSGLQHQVLLAVINGIMLAVRFLGVLPVLWLVSPTIEAFFLWNAGVALVHTAIVAVALWLGLPRAEGRSTFRWSLLKSNWRFTGSTTGISIMGFVLSQADKVVLSKMLSLEMFGYYGLAQLAASSVSGLVSPVFSTLAPRFVQLASLGDREPLRQLYHLGCQFVSILLFPAAAMGILFSAELMTLWTNDLVTVSNTWRVLAILLVGSVLNGVCILPYALQLACGWTRPTFNTTLVVAILAVPLLIVLTAVAGTTGTAIGLAALGVPAVFVTTPVALSRLLAGETRRWFVRDLGAPLAASLGVAVAARLLLPTESLGRVGLLAVLVGTGFVALVAAVMASPMVRASLRQRMAKHD